MIEAGESGKPPLKELASIVRRGNLDWVQRADTWVGGCNRREREGRGRKQFVGRTVVDDGGGINESHEGAEDNDFSKHDEEIRLEVIKMTGRKEAPGLRVEGWWEG